MLYNVPVGFVFSQLHYTTKKAASFFFGMQPFLLFFYSACDVNKTVVCGVPRRSSLRRRAYVESLI